MISPARRTPYAYVGAACVGAIPFVLHDQPTPAVISIVVLAVVAASCMLIDGTCFGMWLQRRKEHSQ